MNTNRVTVAIQTEKGGNPKEGEYDLYLVSMTEPLIIGEVVNDIDLIREAIEAELDFSKLPERALSALH